MRIVLPLTWETPSSTSKCHGWRESIRIHKLLGSFVSVVAAMPSAIRWFVYSEWLLSIQLVQPEGVLSGEGGMVILKR